MEIFNELLDENIDKFRESNTIIKKMDEAKPKNININFIDGPFIEILENDEKQYHIQFINRKNNYVEFELDLKSNHWARSSKKYYVDWLIRVKGVDNDFHFEHQINLENKRVLIGFESKSLGDTLAWISYVEKFRIDRKCEVICSTFHNNLFIKQYPNIQFVDPGTTVHNLNALYRIGIFHTNDQKINYEKHPFDPKCEPLTKVGSDILGLDYVEVKPMLPVYATEKKKIVSIANHATAQCKYWNNPNGWQEVVDFLIDNGYEVKLLSSEEDGHMGNKDPKHVTKIQNKKIEDIMKIIQESELFIGISSGLAWVAWGSRTETILISGFTDEYVEPQEGIHRIINKEVCHGCWGKIDFDPGRWTWCPFFENTDRMFECSKEISSEMVIEKIKSVLKI